MRLSHHPEYSKYLQDREAVQRCERAVAAWRAEEAPIYADKHGLVWTSERALEFVRSLVRMFEAYNRVLWEQFPYCRACGGGCCVLDASRLGPFDGIALALLDLPIPVLPDAIATSARGCIYLEGQECTLPRGWRTIKCWSFYCLGGRWDPGVSLGERHGVLAAALKGVVRDRLPEELRQYERLCGESTIAHLDDPTDFAHALDDALFEILVGPLHARYPLLEEPRAADAAGQADAPSIDEKVLAFVGEAMAQLFESPPSPSEERVVSTDQLLADLELLEWIAAGHPSNQVQLLEEMRARYAGLPARDRTRGLAIGHRLCACIAQMLDQSKSERSARKLD
jgi:hypothetical protein